MISASLAFNIISGDMQKSLDRVASQATVKRDSQYYEENINKVKDVDDFLGNYKLYSYAMKAYGLEDMTYAKAFMKKVLESDLTDSTSFANKLSDTRYKDFAAAFNFGASTTDAQTDSQQDDLIGLYTASYDNEAPTRRPKRTITARRSIRCRPYQISPATAACATTCSAPSASIRPTSRPIISPRC
jgi:hypothetical protein